MDVPVGLRTATRVRANVWALGLAAIVVVGLLLRLRGIHNPILDHPGWRQGDTAAVARNFATLQFNLFYPQTDYNGPPPNYVELELQIVPFLAAIGYKLFGVHEVFGRLISIAFSLGTVAVLGVFARWLFAPRGERIATIAGLTAAFAFAVAPGSVYYGRTFMPDTTMVFFLTAALYACARWIVDDDGGFTPRFAWAAGLFLFAFLAKPVALAGGLAVAVLAFARFGLAGTFRRPAVYALVAIALVPLYAYLHFVGRPQVEWHWASGITQKHVVPSLRHAFTSPHALLVKCGLFLRALQMFGWTIAGPIVGVLALAGFVVPLRTRANALVWGWLGAAALYAFVVVTVERVDYYLYLALPLAALAVANLVASLWERRLSDARDVPPLWLAGAAIVALVVIASTYKILGPYYRWTKANYAYAKALDKRLPPDALIVIGHYDPSIQYYINRKGWEEDPYLWTPFDEQSAIRKSSRYFIAIENNRLRRNVELSNWMLRFPLLDPPVGKWPVYVTDPTQVLPGAEERWQAFRRREKAGLLPTTPHQRVVPKGAGTLVDPSDPGRITR